MMSLGSKCSLNTKYEELTNTLIIFSPIFCVIQVIVILLMKIWLIKTIDLRWMVGGEGINETGFDHSWPCQYLFFLIIFTPPSSHQLGFIYSVRYQPKSVKLQQWAQIDSEFCIHTNGNEFESKFSYAQIWGGRCRTAEMCHKNLCF